MTRERLAVPTQCTQQEQLRRGERERERERDIDLPASCGKIVSCDSKVTQNFGKRIHKLGSLKYGMAGKTEIS